MHSMTNKEKEREKIVREYGAACHEVLVSTMVQVMLMDRSVMADCMSAPLTLLNYASNCRSLQGSIQSM
jgi:hypothetical protein